MTPATARLTVIDTDPGIDDAVGILLALASPEFSVAGITTVGGNIGLDVTTRNAGRLLAHAGRDDIPLLRGAGAPLARPAPEPPALHGGDGLGGVALPEPTRPPEVRPATEWLADLLDRHPEGAVEVLALGPLTNLARLVIDHPQAARRIGRIVIMGGAIREPGNAGPRSEFNLAADPEAAAAVFGSGLSVVLVPLDVTRRVRATRDFAARLAAGGRPAATLAAALIEAYFATAATRESHPLHDPCVMLFALAPELFRTERLGLTVGTAPEDEAGALSVADHGSPVEVATGVDSAAVLDLLARRLTGGRG